MVALGLVGITVPEILMECIWLALSHGIGGGLGALGLNVLNLLMLLNLIGAVVLGVGIVWLVEPLLRLKTPDRWIVRPFGFVALINGYALALTSAASIVGQQDLFNTSWSAVLILSILMHVLWTLLFVRAAAAPRAALAA